MLCHELVNPIQRGPMKHRVFSLAVTLGLVGMAPVALAQSAALQKSQEAAAEVDLSELFSARTDARSQSFKFGGTQEHAFTVDKPGRYVFTSDTLPGESDDYYIKASLLDARGNVIASGDAQGQGGDYVWPRRSNPATMCCA